jgi:hypothetical protein
MKRFRVVNRTTGGVLGDAIDRADTSRTRNEGLLGRSGLTKGEGLWIVPTSAIHMFFMKFAIDVVFLDRQRRVVKTVANLRPWRLAMSLRGHSVLELPVGAIQESGTKPGDLLEVVPLS